MEQNCVSDVENAGEESTGHRSDPVLVQACIAGDGEAWATLVERYNRLVYSVPRRMGMSTSDCEDVTQNVFVILHRYLGSLQDQTRLSAWLITTARRESWAQARRNRPSDELDERMASPVEVNSSDVEELERAQTVRDALGRIDEKCRELLKALFLAPDEPDYQAIATRLGMAIGSIGPTRARCFKKMEKVLAEMGVESAF